ncbi:TDT family transporter [Velocimicrobium porci]|uniref:TDT family transporter n=1 Tax=Velocimicrobium porci TaxID=2606634 RepID=A0A6L5Y4E8_9FIRM|nr:TDT family transporter [Velocimicrobium porci]MSS64993.1 TDT family transporter [Velocimicrobium porci]
MENIKKVPIPLCGVMLGCAALGNLLQSYSEGIRYLFGMIAFFLFILMILKLILYPGMIKEELKNPIMASVSGTFSMALMLLSVYLKPWIGRGAFAVWILAIILHIALILYFTVNFIFKLQMPKVFASYYIVYVGIAVAAITAPAYEQFTIGSIAFWFGFVTLIMLFALITVRYIKYKEVPQPAKPLICIYAAPVSLCLAGYIQSVTPKLKGMIVGMLAVATIIYIFAFIKMLGYLKLPFYPSYAAFTFPFVISAIATKQTMVCMKNLGNPIPALKYMVLIETIVATVLVVYTLIRFLLFIFAGSKN